METLTATEIMDILPEDDPERLALLYVQQWLHEQGHTAGQLKT